MLNCFPSALGMHPVVFPLLGCQRVEQSKVGFTGHAKLLDRLMRIALLIMSAGHPRILVVGRDGSPRGAENHPYTEPSHDFRIVKMGHDLANRPLVSSGALAQFARRHALD